MGPFYPSARQGNNNFRYFIYQPATPKPAAAPIAVLFHGMGANNPETYVQWMQHIVKKGYTVIWLQYTAFPYPGPDADNNAAESYADALARPQADSRLVQPSRDAYGVIESGFVGHSFGSYVAMQVAGLAAQLGSQIPVPKGYFSVGAGLSLVEPIAQDVPSTLKAIFLTGADDSVVCKTGTESIWNQTPQIPAENKIFLAMQTDPRGLRPLTADHTFPVTTLGFGLAVDARDYYGSWKHSVAALDCTIRGTSCEIAFGNGSAEQTGMGLWSDGVAVKPLLWFPSPSQVTLPCELTRSLQ
jgi:alpha/beta superfamily hydrolase